MPLPEDDEISFDETDREGKLQEDFHILFVDLKAFSRDGMKS